MKQRIPWPIKVGFKLAFGAFRVDYRILKKLGLVEHGRMEDVAFARSVFRRHVESTLASQQARPHGCLLEIGPGDSVATGFLGRAADFESVVLVDVGAFADLDPTNLNRLAHAVGGCTMTDSATEAGDMKAALSAVGIFYLTEGVRSLAALAPESVHFSFSNTVLQHAARDEAPELIRLLGRAHARGTYSSHLVKFNDHFSGGFLNLKLSDRIMESRAVKRANLYTNRIDAGQFARLFESAGFRIVEVAVDFADEKLAPRQFQQTEQLIFATTANQALRASFTLHKP